MKAVTVGERLARLSESLLLAEAACRRDVDLGTPDEIQAAVERMVQDARTHVLWLRYTLSQKALDMPASTDDERHEMREARAREAKGRAELREERRQDRALNALLRHRKAAKQAAASAMAEQGQADNPATASRTEGVQ